MNELKQIAAVLRSLGITIEQINFLSDTCGKSVGSDIDNIEVFLNYNSRKVHRSYTIEEIRSALITEPRTQPAGPQRLDHITEGIINSINSG